MKDYYVYRNGQHIAACESELKAKALVYREIRLAREVGLREHAGYKVQYNPMGERGTVLEIEAGSDWPKALSLTLTT